MLAAGVGGRSGDCANEVAFLCRDERGGDEE
jgi:hypothetical protein